MYEIIFKVQKYIFKGPNDAYISNNIIFYIYKIHLHLPSCVYKSAFLSPHKFRKLLKLS